MKLDQFLQTFRESNPLDWQKIDTNQIYTFETETTHNEYKIIPVEYTGAFIKKDDIDFSIFYVFFPDALFDKEHSGKFINESWYKLTVHLRFRGQLIYPIDLIKVDGGKFVLPLPRKNLGNKLIVNKFSHDFSRLFFELLECQVFGRSFNDIFEEFGFFVE